MFLTLIKIFIVLLLVVLGIFAYTFNLFSKSVYTHVPSSNETPSADLDTTLNYVTSDNLKIAYWYFPVENSKAVVILVHGYNNPGGKRQMLNQSEYLRKAGYSTALLDLRSFGDSEGDKVTFGVNEYKDVEAVYNYISQLQENKGKKIGFLGISMGAATSLVTAGQTQKGDFVIASVPFYSVNSMLKAQVIKRGLPSNLILPFSKLCAFVTFGFNYNKYSPQGVTDNIKVPVLLFLATNDQEIVMNDSKKLINEISGKVDYWEVDSSHDIYGEQPQEFEKRVLEFLEKITTN